MGQYHTGSVLFLGNEAHGINQRPHGTVVIFSTATLSKSMLDAEAGRALYLVDLRDPGRAVTHIPAPLAPSPGAAKETK